MLKFIPSMTAGYTTSQKPVDCKQQWAECGALRDASGNRYNKRILLFLSDEHVQHV